MPNKFYADFVVENEIILEVKCSSTIIEKHYAQVINYLTISKLQVGLILNFSEKSLEYKRVILKSYYVFIICELAFKNTVLEFYFLSANLRLKTQVYIIKKYLNFIK